MVNFPPLRIKEIISIAFKGFIYFYCPKHDTKGLKTIFGDPVSVQDLFFSIFFNEFAFWFPFMMTRVDILLFYE